MALKINSTPTLKGKEAQHFLKEIEENKVNKISKEEAERIKAFTQRILSKAKI
jgi:hypothetical protein